MRILCNNHGKQVFVLVLAGAEFGNNKHIHKEPKNPHCNIRWWISQKRKGNLKFPISCVKLQTFFMRKKFLLDVHYRKTITVAMRCKILFQTYPPRIGKLWKYCSDITILSQENEIVRIMVLSLIFRLNFIWL